MPDAHSTVSHGFILRTYASESLQQGATTLTFVQEFAEAATGAWRPRSGWSIGRARPLSASIRKHAAMAITLSTHN
jgi:hypothetical protein